MILSKRYFKQFYITTKLELQESFVDTEFRSGIFQDPDPGDPKIRNTGSVHLLSPRPGCWSRSVPCSRRQDPSSPTLQQEYQSVSGVFTNTMTTTFCIIIIYLTYILDFYFNNFCHETEVVLYKL